MWPAKTGALEQPIKTFFSPHFFSQTWQEGTKTRVSKPLSLKTDRYAAHYCRNTEKNYYGSIILQIWELRNDLLTLIRCTHHFLYVFHLWQLGLGEKDPLLHLQSHQTAWFYFLFSSPMDCPSWPRLIARTSRTCIVSKTRKIRKEMALLTFHMSWVIAWGHEFRSFTIEPKVK